MNATGSGLRRRRRSRTSPNTSRARARGGSPSSSSIGRDALAARGRGPSWRSPPSVDIERVGWRCGLVRAVKLAAAFLLALLLPGHASAACKTIVVTKAAVAYPHAATIQAGVNRAKPCDWVLVAPGRYSEQVVIRTAHLHLRGLNRNTVVVDGLHRVGHGIVVDKTNDVWIENLTVR